MPPIDQPETASRIEMQVGYMLCIFSSFVIAGCAGDDSDTVALIEKHVAPVAIKREEDDRGIERIVSVSIPNAKSALEVLPHLGNLEYLKTLKIGYKRLQNEDLRTLPALPDLEYFGTGLNPLSDEGLKYLASMKGLQRLNLMGSKVRGPGLAYLKGFNQLEWLELHSTPVDDSAIPHIVENFPRLKRLSLANTNVTPKGLMQLADLHWLETLGPPADMIGPDPTVGETRDERRRLEKVRQRARMVLMNKFSEAHIAAKQRARAAGLDVPPDHRSPFRVAKQMLEAHDKVYDKNGQRREPADKN